MNKKGFTLIEMLTVVAILSILFVTFLPKINTAFKESRADQLQEVREMVATATEVYLDTSCGEKQMDLLKETDQVTIYLSSISDCGLIEEKVYNPVSGDYVDLNNEYVIATINDIGLIQYEVSF